MSDTSVGLRAANGDQTISLRVRMLGAFECWRGDEPIAREAWRTRPTLTLLKLLIDERDRPVPVDRLIEAVWPESEPSAARQSLQVAIRTLRTALEPGLRRGADSRFIRTESGAYRFDSTDCSLDVDLFLAASQRALSGQRRELQATLAACDDVVSLYRGEYLADDPYSEWTFSPRERLRSRYLDVLDVFTSALATSGEWERAAHWLERALELDPLREALYRRLARCHVAQGRRSHAIAVLDRCSAVLKRELGVEPAVETAALYEQVARRDPVGAASHEHAVTAVRGSADLPLPFVGRSADLAALRRAHERAQNEAGLFAVVSGPPGIGKSSLVQEYCDRFLSSSGSGSSTARALWMRCHEFDRTVPFAPLVRLLASWLDQQPSVADRRRLEHYAPALMRFVPQARTLLADDRNVQATFEVGQLLEATTQAVKTMLRDSGGVLVVDDLQWADASTILWLSYMLQRLDPGTLTIATQRTAADAAGETDQLLDEARRAGKFIAISLGPLELGALDELVASRLQEADRRSELTLQLHRSTGGQPLFVVEMLRDLVSTGRLYVDAHGAWRFDQSSAPVEAAGVAPGEALQGIILGRVTRLEPDALDAFQAMCVVAAECRASHVAAITGASLGVTLGALERLLDNELVRVLPDRNGYVIEHPIVRDVVFASLSAPRRQAWHLKVARGLREVAQDYATSSGQELQHLIAGDAPPREIVDVAEQAGEVAMQRAAIADALGYFETALERLRELPPAPETRSQLARLHERRADALVAAGRWDDANTAFDALRATRADPLGRARAMRKQASVFGDAVGNFDLALELLARADEELGHESACGETNAVRVERGRISAVRASVHFYQSQYQQVIQHGQRALERWAGLEDVERDEIELVIRLGNAEQRMGRVDAAEAHFRSAVARAEVLGDRELETRCRAAAGGLSGVVGGLTEALEINRQTAAFGREFGIPRMEMVGHANIGVILNELGDLRAARESYELALQQARQLEAEYTEMHVMVGLGEVLVRMGEAERARRMLKQGIELAEAIHSVQRRGHAYLHLAELNLLQGQPEKALVWAERGIATGGEIQDFHVEREGRQTLSLALTALGRTTEAEQEAMRGLNVAQEGGFRMSMGRNLRALGEAQAASGKLERAWATLASAEEIFRAAQAKYDLAATLVAQALIANDRIEADFRFGEARDLARACSAGLLLQRIEAMTALSG